MGGVTVTEAVVAQEWPGEGEGSRLGHGTPKGTAVAWAF